MSHSDRSPTKSKLAALTLGAVGVVYGDIGTSPLYAFRESLHAAMGTGTAQSDMVMGILSLIIWALFVIVTLKYVVLLMRADNNGEGGILSLMALAHKALGKSCGWTLALGMAGAAMFYGDAIITPAISVLSAVEGLNLVTNKIDHFIIPISLLILGVLFAFQSKGTEKVSWIFAPVMILWFAVLAVGGLLQILSYPQVLEAINPYYAFYYLTNHGYTGFITLGAVFLAATGAEALYADMGHFGKKPIRLAWVGLVMPSLLLNYFGQAALILSNPESAKNPFFLLYPTWALLPMVILSTFATIIASQAVITGAYSMTHQAIQLGLLPRLSVRYTSVGSSGQVYMPQVNWLLLGGVVMLIAVFHTSSNLASAYGIAVTGTMVITATLAFIVIRKLWKWNIIAAIAVITPLLAIDISFFAANLTKLAEGGFIPLLIAAFLMLLMKTWMQGSVLLHKQLYNRNNSITSLLEMLEACPPQNIEGTAIYLSGNLSHAPSALLQNLRHYNLLHKHNFIVHLHFTNEPFAADNSRIHLTKLNDSFTQIIIDFGYMESPDVPSALKLLDKRNIHLDMESASFFVSRHHIVTSASFGMPVWQDRIFIALVNNADYPQDYFNLPHDRVVILGVQLRV